MLSARFSSLMELCKESSISLHDLDRSLGEDGAPLFIIILCFPFFLPMPLPGVSTAFGMAIIFLEARTYFKTPPPLPRFIGQRHLSKDFVEKLSQKGQVFFSKIEHIFAPRLALLTEGPGRFILSTAVVLSAIGLSLPFPPVIPFTNTLPAIAIVFLSAAMVFRDGLLAIIGHIVHICTWTYYAFVGGALFLAIERIFEYFREVIN